MSRPFAIDMEWLDGSYGAPEIRQTTGWLDIVVDGQRATRNEDHWSRTVRSTVLVSGFPLALWLATSWWRLKRESAPSDMRNISWRMAHELPAAGHGYVWPCLSFTSDGEGVEIRCRIGDSDPSSTVSYLSHFAKRLSAADFELAVRDFIDFVLARLDAVGILESDLHVIWGEIDAECRDKIVANRRSFEARLGFDPDEAPVEVVDRLMALASDAGEDAAAEIASACAGERAGAELMAVQTLAANAGLVGRIDLEPSALIWSGPTPDAIATPWDRGHDLARTARQVLGFGSAPVSDAQLSGILGIAPGDLSGSNAVWNSSKLGLAIRADSSNELRFVYRKPIRQARRFESARFLGDFLSAPFTDKWLPSTDTKTARQKMQRAFAAEFLMPIVSLKEFMIADFSQDNMEAAAEHFQVSPLAVRSHLANHGLVPAF